MSKGKIIVAFSGVRKTYLAEKYDNVFDLDHLFYKYEYDEGDVKKLNILREKFWVVPKISLAFL